MKKKIKDIWYKPILFQQLKSYNTETFFKDLLSGIIVGVVALPLGIAFGIASGVTPEKGIISCIVAGLLCALMGGSKYQITGPTGALIVIVSGIVTQHGLEGLFIATFISGVILVVMGLMKAGSVIKFIPYPVIVGFTSGIAVTIFSTQVKDFFGMDITSLPINFIPKWQLYFNSISTINYYALAVSILTIILIRACVKISPKIPAYLTVIIIVSVTNYILRYHFGIEVIQTIGDKFEIDSSIPKAQNLGLSLESVKELFSSGFTIAIFGSIVTLLSSTVADGLKSDSHNPNTELIGQGAANMVAPIFGGIPVTGAIARTLTNISNGGRTPIVSIIHSIILLFILLFLGDLSKHIPMACLAGILVLISYNMSDWRTCLSLMKMPKGDVLVFLTTFILTVIFDLTVAIEAGLILAVISFIRRISQVGNISEISSKIGVGGTHNIDETPLEVPAGVDIYEIEGPFFFGMANKLEEVNKDSIKKSNTLIIRMRNVPFVDSTGINNLTILLKNSKKAKNGFILSGVQEDVYKSLEAAGFVDKIGRENIYSDINEALEGIKNKNK